MLSRRIVPVALALLGAGAIAAGCGGSSSSSSGSSSGGQGAVPLSGEAKSAATGDIPDNQVFLTFRNAGGGYAMRYPEGWAQRGTGRDVTFQDKNNVVHVVVIPGSVPSPSAAGAQLSRLSGSIPSLRVQAAKRVTIKGTPVVKVTYTTESKPNPVTGKRVKLTVDRYELAHNGKVATVDLGTAIGVDNVDAYRMMIQSFRWT